MVRRVCRKVSLPNRHLTCQCFFEGAAGFNNRRFRPESGTRKSLGTQGRYKAFLVEDAGYNWTLSRYIHLNPCNGGKPLADNPESWPHSSFAGYARKSKRVDWVAYDQLHTYWSASVGGSDAARAYRRDIKDGLNFPENPFKEELREWVFGSEDFLRRMVALASGDDEQRHRSTSRRLKSVSVQEIVDATAAVARCPTMPIRRIS